MNALAEGLGAVGGNVILLYGDKDYINRAHRLVAPLDLPLPGIDLQLWGVQISSGRPDRLVEVMADVRGEISLTQQLVRDTFSLLQLEAQQTLYLGLSDLKSRCFGLEERLERLPAIPLNCPFVEMAEQLGYGSALNSNRNLSILDIFLVGKAVENPADYYNALYDSVVNGKIENDRFQAFDTRFQPYFDAMRETDRPPFERVFRSRGLKPDCMERNPSDGKCEIWDWKETYLGSVKTAR